MIIRYVLEKKVSRTIHREVTAESVRVNPYTLLITVKKLEISHINGIHFAGAEELVVHPRIASLFSKGLIIQKIHMVKPTVKIIREEPKKFNFSDLITSTGAGNKETSPFSFSLGELTISDGGVTLIDRYKGVDHSLDLLNITMRNLTNRPGESDMVTSLNLSGKLNGALVSLSGKGRPFSETYDTSADLGINKLAVSHYLPYIQQPANLQIISAELNTRLAVTFSREDQPSPLLQASGNIILKNTKLEDDNNQPYLLLPELKAVLSSSELMSGNIHLSDLAIVSPEITLTRLDTGRLNKPGNGGNTAVEKAAGAIQAEANTPEVKTAGKEDPVVIIDHLTVADGKIAYTDNANSTPFFTHLTAVNLSVDNLNTMGGKQAEYRLSAETESNEAIAGSGRFSLFPFAFDGSVDLKNIQATKYTPYYRDRFSFRIRKGIFNLHTELRYPISTPNPHIEITDIRLSADTLDIGADGSNESIIAADNLSVEDAAINIEDKKITIGKLSSPHGSVRFLRDTDRKINLKEIFLPGVRKQKEPDTDAEIIDPVDKSRPPWHVARPPWHVAIDTASLNKFAFLYEDRVPAEPVKINLEDITLTIRDFSTLVDKKSRATLSTQWNQSGQVSATGMVSIRPFGLDVTVKTNQVDIRSVQPYFSHKIGLTITGGDINTDGHLVIFRKRDAGSSIQYPVQYRGTASITHFGSIDKENADDLIKWKSLYLSEVDINTAPTRISIGNMALSDFFARAIVNPEGGFNLISALGKRETSSKPEAAEKKKKTENPIRIDMVTLQGGEIHFSDRFIQPNFNTTFLDMGGKINGLISKENQYADVFLKGTLGNHAQVQLTGKVNPIIENIYADMQLKFSDIEMSPFTPYIGKYLGYLVEKGKLALDMKYLVADNKLQGQNKVFLDQFTLGDSSESSSATNLPIKLAIALLKDRNGNINLDLPVTGQLDDPKFNLGKTILTILKNIVVKIVTAPFSILGAIGGGGEELQFLEFEPGSSTLTDTNREKIEKLVKILYERPRIKLEIEGHADDEKDRAGLMRHTLDNLLISEKRKALLKEGKKAPPLEEITLTPREHDILLTAIYEAAEFPKPRDNDGKVKKLSVAEMEKLLITHMEFTHNNLRRLAHNRAFNAKNQVLKTGQVTPDRVFIVEPKIISAQSKEDEKENKTSVVFKLK